MTHTTDLRAQTYRHLTWLKSYDPAFAANICTRILQEPMHEAEERNGVHTLLSETDGKLGYCPYCTSSPAVVMTGRNCSDCAPAVEQRRRDSDHKSASDEAEAAANEYRSQGCY